MDAMKQRGGKVNVDQLLQFIFPNALQHPLSTGRLYAFGMYGPLDENAKLRAGHNGKRVVSGWEIDTMCMEFEREDILRVYVSGKRPLFTLSEDQKEEVIAQADSHLKAAKGRGYRRQVTRTEVVTLLSNLLRDSTGLVSFHDAQKLIVGYREEQIARFRVIFPDIVPQPTKSLRHEPALEPAGTLTTHAATTLACRTGEVNGGARKKVTTSSLPDDGGLDGGTSTKRLSRKRANSGRAKFSPDVAPSTMFLKDMGFTPAGMAKQTNKLLNIRVYKVGNIADGNDPSLTQNVRLIREDRPPEQAGHGSWDSYACLRGKNIGGHVRSARSSTTATRKA